MAEFSQPMTAAQPIKVRVPVVCALLLDGCIWVGIGALMRAAVR